MYDPPIKIGSLVEHILDGCGGEVVGYIYDIDGQIESLSVWLDNGKVMDDYIEFWEHIEVEPLPDNVIEAADRFRNKK